MRTTLDIDDDVLAVARARAEREHVSIGRVLSALARAALQRPAGEAPAIRNGLPVLPNARAARPVTLEIVNQLRDETP
ncbi:CopG family transcriptional regulator [Cupriavidus basilensis]|uniref:CopG family transcriptional regulator n=1 Tax=Cupriavidus basilensis TaxID=68895 RepID=A0ABT6ATN4_9BURK|nr:MULTISPECIES: CopG family transcriptional regulator [Cupriavidus]MDF3835824.1 CopG family transcriptional regulator [Cupriavidus basilensis]MDW3685782.1 CopG family transcriptional regulator [Cupriavidus sp. CV2]